MEPDRSSPLPNELPGWMERTIQLIGEENGKKLNKAHVMIAGLGGVGSAAAEALVRAGIGRITIVDNDLLQESNINRQIPALHSTMGKHKTEVMQARLKDINPLLKLEAVRQYIDAGTVDGLLEGPYDFIVDAIDTLTPKILLLEKAFRSGVPLTSSMGSGGKTDPMKIRIADFKNTYNCRLAYLLRKKLGKKGIRGGFKVVFSTELTDKELLMESSDEPNKKSVIGTLSYIPAIFGNMLASIVVDGLIEK